MMTRAAPLIPVSSSDFASIALTFVALVTATFALSSYAEGSRPVSEFLYRAQSESEARGFEELLGTLGEKPPATHAATQIARVDEPPVAAKPATASAPNVTPPAKSIALPEKLAAKPQVAVVHSPSGGKKVDFRKVQKVARRSADDWVRQGSSIVRLVTARF